MFENVCKLHLNDRHLIKHEKKKKLYAFAFFFIKVKLVRAWNRMQE